MSENKNALHSVIKTCRKLFFVNTCNNQTNRKCLPYKLLKAKFCMKPVAKNKTYCRFNVSFRAIAVNELFAADYKQKTGVSNRWPDKIYSNLIW